MNMRLDISEWSFAVIMLVILYIVARCTRHHTDDFECDHAED